MTTTTAYGAYTSSVASATAAEAATVQTAVVKRQEAEKAQTHSSGIVVSGNNVNGPGYGVSTAQMASIKAAQAAEAVTDATAQQTYNGTVDIAKATLRNAGDVNMNNPF